MLVLLMVILIPVSCLTIPPVPLAIVSLNVATRLLFGAIVPTVFTVIVGAAVSTVIAKNATVELFNGTTSFGTVTAHSGGNFTLDIDLLAGSLHEITAQATDAAGNVSEVSGVLAYSAITFFNDNTPRSFGNSFTKCCNKVAIWRYCSNNFAGIDNSSAWTFSAASLSTTVAWSGANVDVTDGYINTSELSTATITGKITNLSNASGLSISEIKSFLYSKIYQILNWRLG
jgi:hypothetical protein